ncbi:recombinase family protein [Nocardia sp. NBC_00881]|nr:recombinase family protein [Nocardia sp. NBC_00881]
MRAAGIGLHVVDQGIDASTMEGRAMFGMLSVLAELRRELIVANTNDGLAAAPPSNSPACNYAPRLAPPHSPANSANSSSCSPPGSAMRPTLRHHHRSQLYSTETS